MDEDEALRPDDTRGMNGLLANRMAEGGGGMLCNDENGLCLGSRGNMDTSKAGIYTSIAKLASLLDSTVDGLGGVAVAGGGLSEEVPIVTIHTEKSEFIVKEYSGRTVVFRVPAIKDTGGGDDTAEEIMGGEADEDGTVNDEADKSFYTTKSDPNP